MKNLSMHASPSEQTALKLFYVGDSNKAMAETPLNDVSFISLHLSLKSSQIKNVFTFTSCHIGLVPVAQYIHYISGSETALFLYYQTIETPYH